MRCRVPRRAWDSCGPLAAWAAWIKGAALSAVVVVVAGCAHPETAADRHFAEMREQVSRLQEEHDKAERRLGGLEAAPAPEPSARGELRSTPPSPRPSAGVVQLGETAEVESDDPNDPGARPDIRLTGVPGPASRLRGKSSGRGRVDEGDGSAVRADTSRSSALDPEAKKIYESALALVQAKQYDRGLEALSAFLVRWPDHPYAENATYWRGEAYFGQGEYLRAAEQFEATLMRFGGSKAPDALLKLGMCHDRSGAPQRAREYWDRLRKEHPRSDAAKRIPAAPGTAVGTRTNAGGGSGSGGPREDVSPKGPKENR